MSIEFDKKTGKSFCKPSTKDIILCLSDAPHWCKVLHDHTSAPYKDFLGELIKRNFFRNDERLVIGNIAKEFKLDNTKLNKLVSKIYDEIFDLNTEQPELFQQPGILHDLHFKYFDSHCYLNIWLPVTPRLYETMMFDFVKAKVGTIRFSLTEVIHEIRDNGTTISLSLNGGNVNPYRQWLIDRALFEEKLGLFNIWNVPDYKLDEELRKLYR